jgi:hypothetical protein
MSHSTIRYGLIPDFPGYRVGTDGSVWSSFYKVYRGWERGGPWRRLRATPNSTGRLTVGLTNPDGKLCSRYVHLLVLLVFIGPCPDGLEACHENGDHLDNRLDNLRYDTHQANMDDRERHKRTAKGLCNGKGKLSDKDREAICLALGRGEATQRQLAIIYQVHPSVISRARNYARRARQ